MLCSVRSQAANITLPSACSFRNFAHMFDIAVHPAGLRPCLKGTGILAAVPLYAANEPGTATPEMGIPALVWLLVIITFLVSSLLVILVRALKENRNLRSEAETNSREMNRLYQLLQRHDRKHKNMLARLETSRENYKNIFNSVSHGIVLVNPLTFQILRANSRFQLMLGRDMNPLVQTDIRDLFPESDNQDSLLRLIGRCMHEEKVHSDWFMQTGPGPEDGTWVNLSLIHSRYEDETCVLISFADISQRKMAEMDIRITNLYLNALLRIHQALNNDAILSGWNVEVLQIINETCTSNEVLYMEREQESGPFLKVADYHPELSLSQGFTDSMIPSLSLPAAMTDDLAAGREIVLGPFESRKILNMRENNDMLQSLVFVPVFFHNTLKGLIVLVYQYGGKQWFKYESDFVASCATALALYRERQSMIAAINEREQQFRTLANNQQAGIFIVRGREIVFANARFFELSGLKSTTRINTLFKFIADMSRSEFISNMAMLQAGRRKMIRMDLEIRLPDQRINWLDFFGSRIQFHEEDALLFSVYDITQKKRAEKRLKLAQFSIDTAMDCIIWFNDTGNITYVNQQTCALLNYQPDELLDHHYSLINEEFTAENWDSIWQELLKQGNKAALQTLLTCHDGTKVPVESMLEIFHFQDQAYAFTYSRDIRRRLEEERSRNELKEQLNRAERLESLGFMAAGVAHEINNPMMGILNYTQIIHDKVDDRDLKSYTETILREGSRISEIVSKLLDFSSPRTDIPVPVLFDTIIEDSLVLVGANLKKSQIILENRIPKRSILLSCKKGSIQQVVLNLLQNARHSLDKKFPSSNENKRIVLSAEFRVQDDLSFVDIVFRDHGNGISPRHLPHIFTPYFTTKVRNEGTGLGLALSHSIIREHGGRLSVRSEEGVFAEFIMSLPAEPVSGDRV